MLKQLLWTRHRRKGWPRDYFKFKYLVAQAGVGQIDSIRNHLGCSVVLSVVCSWWRIQSVTGAIGTFLCDVHKLDVTGDGSNLFCVFHTSWKDFGDIKEAQKKNQKLIFFKKEKGVHIINAKSEKCSV